MSRIRANLITNQSADGSPTVQNGLVIAGVTTSTSFSGSGAPLTNLPASQLSGTAAAINGSNITNLNASNIASGTVPTARLGSGTANSSTFLAGDSTFKTVTGTTINNNADNRVITGSGTANTLEGEANLTFNGGVTGDAQLTVHAAEANANSDSELILETSNDFATSVVMFKDTTGEAGSIAYNHGDNYIKLSTNGTNGGTERLRISSTGNLALGSTHGSGFSNHTNFFLGGMGNLYVDTSASSGSSFSMSNNAYINSAGNWVYRTGGKASNIYHYEGAIGFRNAGPGSAGNTISWSEGLKIDNNGYVTKPSQPSFAAFKAANSYTQSGVIVFDATRHNIGGHYSTSNGRFTAPVAGRYQFTFYSIIKGNYSNAYYSIRINGSAGSGMYVHVSQSIGNVWEGECTTWILDLNANDYVDINSNSSINWHGNDWQLFSGQLLS